MSRKHFWLLMGCLSVGAFLLGRQASSQAPTSPPSVINPPPAIPPVATPPSVPIIDRPLAPASPNAPAETRPASTPSSQQKKLPSIWSLQVEEVEGKNVVRATIGKKSELKIACEHVDLHTQAGTLQAHGKVELSGENFEGRCEKLLINLHEDRLLLDGNAEVGIVKQTAYYGKDDKEYAKKGPRQLKQILLELKGQKLSLRWPDLQTKGPDLQTKADSAVVPANFSTVTPPSPPLPSDIDLKKSEKKE